jgi:hypothetical protein
MEGALDHLGMGQIEGKTIAMMVCSLLLCWFLRIARFVLLAARGL